MPLFLPVSAELAQRLGVFQYRDVGGYCLDCHNHDPIRYVPSHDCRNCALVRETSTINDDPSAAFSAMQAVERDLPGYFRIPEMCRRGPHLLYRPINGSGRCLTCRAERDPMRVAIREGLTHFVPLKPCPRCGKRAKIEVATGRCRGCQTSPWRRTPAAVAPEGMSREDAQDALYRFYVHPTSCRYDHADRVRYCSTGGCVECAATPRRERSDSDDERLAAPAGFSRREAANLGFRFFHTGRPCRRGHDALRYCSTGGCVRCQRC